MQSIELSLEMRILFTPIDGVCSGEIKHITDTAVLVFAEMPTKSVPDGPPALGFLAVPKASIIAELPKVDE